VWQAVVYAANNDPRRSILDATYGYLYWKTCSSADFLYRRCLMFFGTPHGGANNMMVQSGQLAAKIARTLMGTSSTDLFKALKEDTVFSEQLKTYFRNQHEKYQILSFYERHSNVGAELLQVYSR
jgi:hypothetical protein